MRQRLLRLSAAAVAIVAVITVVHRVPARRGAASTPAPSAQAPASAVVVPLAAGAPQAVAPVQIPVARENADRHHFFETRPDFPDELMKWRLLSQRDENGRIPVDGIIRGKAQADAMRRRQASAAPAGRAGVLEPPTAGISNGAWTWIGPGNIGGRVRTLAVHPTTTTTIFAGSVGGGIWKSTDSGTTWSFVNDFMANLAVTSIVFRPGTPSTMYAGTGEGFYNGDSIQGAGIFKSTDSGVTWSQLSFTATSNFFFVNRLAMSADGATLLAATKTGLWRSTDQGVTFTKVLTPPVGFPYRSDITDVKFLPGSSTGAVASGYSFDAYYSSTGGATFNQATGITAANFSRVEIGVSAAAPATVFLSVDHTPQAAGSGQLWKSIDSGASYALVSTPGKLATQGWYDNLLWVDPTNISRLISGGVDLHRSIDGGLTWTKISDWTLAPNSAHADHHIAVSDPGYNGTSNVRVYFGDDGGLYKADNVLTVTSASGGGFTTLNHNLGVTQFYGIGGNVTSGKIIGGTQDNGTLLYTTGGGPQGWTTEFGGDGGWSAADPTDVNYLYGEYVYLRIHRSSNGGASAGYIYGSGCGAGTITDACNSNANFISPFILDPNNPNRMLGGGVSLWQSTNVKATTPTWAAIKGPATASSPISAIAVATGNPDRVWVGHNSGAVYMTNNGTAVTPTWTPVGSGTLPARMVTRITVDPANANIVYVTVGGYTANNVWRTPDNGTTWSNASGSGGTALPSVPMHSLAINPANSNWLYVGTEVGVFASSDAGAHWTVPQDGPANVAVHDLFWMGTKLVAGTHGRGLFTVQTAGLGAGSASIISESVANGYLDAGEVVTMSLCVANNGASTTGTLTGTLQATGGVQSPSAAQSYGTLAAGATGCRNYTFFVNVACGGTLTATLQVQESGGSTLGLTYSLPVGNTSTSFSQNFDGVAAPALPAGWTTSTLFGTANPWTTSATGADTAPNRAFANDLTTNSDSVLTSPSIAIPAGGGRLTFRHSFITDEDYDGGVLEISISGGAFQDIITSGGSWVTGGYTGTLNGIENNPLGVRDAWVGDSGGYMTTTVNLPATSAGHNIALRWRFGSGDTFGGGPWSVDTISIASVQCAVYGTVSATPTSLKFGATKNGAAGAITAVTPAQSVTVTFAGGGSGWTASANQSWLQLTGASAAGAGTFTAAIVNPGNVIAGNTSLNATITVTALAATNSPINIPVTLTIDQTGSSTQPAFGQVDTPTQSASGIVGAIGVTGWVIDDIGVQSVKLYRNCLGFDNPASCQSIAGSSVVFIGDAAFVPGARPDVESAFASYPAGNIAGWGYLLLTNMLPNVTGSQGFGGQGTITLYAFATDIEGHVTLIGRSQGDHTPTSFTMANTGIAKPFGAIDTPAQGGTVSGTFPNFGWVLTPDLNTIADGTDILMPINGSTITLYIDGVGVGTVTYNQCRGSVGNPVPGGVYCNDDVSNIFGNTTPQPTFTTRTSNPTKFRNLDAARSAIGSYDINTSGMSNGMHSIAWGVSDSNGRGEGIGSRNFFVLNGGAGAMLLGEALTGLNAMGGTSQDAVRAQMLAALESRGDISSLPATIASVRVSGRTGFSPRSPFDAIATDTDGVRRVQIPDLGRVELHLGGFAGAGYLVAGQTLRDLPVGSHLDATTGTFTWAPAPGYFGTYHLVFVVNGDQLQLDVTIRPMKTPEGESEIRMHVNQPGGGAAQGQVKITGSAVDPQAFTGSGIGAVHVWAYRLDTPSAAPQFVGAAELSREGFALSTNRLAPGEYDVVVYAWCVRTERWEDARTVRITVK